MAGDHGRQPCVPNETAHANQRDDHHENRKGLSHATDYSGSNEQKSGARKPANEFGGPMKQESIHNAFTRRSCNKKTLGPDTLRQRLLLLLGAWSLRFLIWADADEAH